ncbi:MAG: single-stranded DNA-binding protein [Planctomycetes bacterium]|nr:single-stranded DNA-binding protein [Planctomycetota bacterium]
MSGGYNKVILVGRLTRDPELRFTPQGTSVCDIGLATSRNYKGSDGNMKQEVCFVDITTWNKQAEVCAEYLKKGREVLIEGRLTLVQWETKEGQKRNKLKVTAERVVFLSSSERKQQSSAPEQSSSPADSPVEEVEPVEGDVDGTPG